MEPPPGSLVIVALEYLGKVVRVEASPTTSIQQVKDELQEKLNLRSEFQKIYNGGTVLKDEQVIFSLDMKGERKLSVSLDYEKIARTIRKLERDVETDSVEAWTRGISVL